MPKVMVIGSANVDFTVRVDHLPQAGETVSGGELYTAFGGKGANQAVAAHRAGAEVQFLAKVGSDQNGDAVIKEFSALGLSCGNVLRDEARPTGVALIMVDKRGHNAIAVAPGSNANLTEEDIRVAEPLLASCQVLLVQLEIPLPAVRESLRLARAHGLMTILNPAPAYPLPAEVLSTVDILTPNEVEAGALTATTAQNMNEITGAAGRLLQTGVGQVIVTLGENGACWVRGGATRTFSPISVEALDSTAAGDAFNGALACALAEGKALEEAIPFANAAGAISVTRRGAQASLPTREEILELLAGSRG